MAREFWTVYRLYDADRTLLYVGCTSKLMQRLHQHTSYQEWGCQVATVDCEHYDRKQDALDREQELIRSWSPLHNSWPPERESQPALDPSEVPDHFELDKSDWPLETTRRFADDFLTSQAKRHPAFGRAVSTGKVHVVHDVEVNWHDNGRIRASAACGRGLSEIADRPADSSEMCGRCARSRKVAWRVQQHSEEAVA